MMWSLKLRNLKLEPKKLSRIGFAATFKIICYFETLFSLSTMIHYADLFPRVWDLNNVLNHLLWLIFWKYQLSCHRTLTRIYKSDLKFNFFNHFMKISLIRFLGRLGHLHFITHQASLRGKKTFEMLVFSLPVLKLWENTYETKT